MLNGALSSNKVAKAFAKCAEQYPSHTHVQQYFEDCLYRIVDREVPNERCLVDLGAGRARGLMRWAKTTEHRRGIAVDFAASALSYTDSHHVLPICSDIHRLPFEAECLTTVISNFALQWCNPVLVGKEVARVLKPGGRFVLAVPVQGSLSELMTVSSGIGENVVNPLPSTDDWLDGLTPFVCENTDHDRYQAHYPSVLSVLKGIKGMGASTRYGHANQGLKTRRWLSALESAYEAFLVKKNGLIRYPVTWEVLILQVRKKG